MNFCFCCDQSVPLITRSTCSELWSVHVDSAMYDLRFDSCHLFYLCKFSLVLYTKCFLSCILCGLLIKVKFIEVKQARWVKPEVTCSWIYITTHSKPREDSGTNGGPKWQQIWTFSKIIKNLHFIQIENFLK